MVRALCRFNLVQTVAPDWRQIESLMALDLIKIPAVSALILTTMLQVERKKAKGGSTAVGLFNPMRFLHSIETWKKEETEV